MVLELLHREDVIFNMKPIRRSEPFVSPLMVKSLVELTTERYLHHCSLYVRRLWGKSQLWRLQSTAPWLKRWSDNLALKRLSTYLNTSHHRLTTRKNGFLFINHPTSTNSSSQYQSRIMSSLSYINEPGAGEKHSDMGHYSQIVVIGNIAKLSGQGGWDETGELSKYDWQQQIDNAFDNVERVLKAAGLRGWEDVSLRTLCSCFATFY
jgi:enamine deaminase RidA (YjgF/YER057c/UK114 family)